MANGTDGELFGLTTDEGVDLRRLGEMESGEGTAEEKEKHMALQRKQIKKAVRAEKELKALLGREGKRFFSAEEAERLQYLRGHQYDIETLAAFDSKLAKKKRLVCKKAAIERLCRDSGALHVSGATIDVLLLKFGYRKSMLEALEYVIHLRDELEDPFGDLDGLRTMAAFLRERDKGK